MATVSQQIQQIYVGLLGRAADQAGLDYWTAEIEGGVLTIEELRANIVNEQPEYEAGLGSMTRAEAVAALYEALFNRAPEAEGLEYWVNGEGSTVNFDQLILALVNGASEADAAALANKVAAAEYYTSSVGDAYTAESAAAAVADVDATAESLAASKAATDAFVNPGFSLTAALADLQAANQAKVDFLEAAELEEGDVATNLTDKVNAVDDLVTGDYAAASTGVRAALVADQQAANQTALTSAQTALTTAQANVNAVAGLAAAVANYKAAQDVTEAATATVADKEADLAGAKASYDVKNSSNITVNGNGTVDGLIVLDGNVLKLATDVTETTNPGVTALLSASIAKEAADAAMTSATAAEAAALSVVNNLDLSPAAVTALEAVAGAMTVVTLADGALPTQAQIATEIAGLNALLQTALADEAYDADYDTELVEGDPDYDAAAAAAAAAVAEAQEDLEAFQTLVDAYDAAAATNPRLNALEVAEVGVEGANEDIADLAAALADLAEAQGLVAQLADLNAAITAAIEVITDEGFTAPVTLAAVNNATTASDLYVLGDVDATINNFSLLGDDVLFIGSGYTLVTLGADQQITQRVGDAATLEVFVKQVAGNVELYVEGQTFAGNGTTSADITTVTLTGISVDDLMFENGVFSLA